jgi:hypothetical protein
MLKTLLSVALCLIAVGSGAAYSHTVQSAAVASKADLAQRHLENVRIEVKGIRELFSRFSFSYDIPVGLEVARNENDWTAYHIDFNKGTLSDLLAQFASEYKQYAWEIEDGVVSVFPKEDYRDLVLRELLATEINSFSVKEKTSCWALGDALVSTPEISRVLARYGLTHDAGYLGGFYIQQLGQRFAFDVSKMQLKSILDKVIRESPVARIWYLRNDSSAQRLSLTVKARLEYPAKNLSEPGSMRRNFF